MTPPPFARILVLPRSRAAALGPSEALVWVMEPGCVMDRPWLCDGKGVIVLCFSDVGENNPGAMTAGQAARLAEFVQGLPADKGTLIVSCFAGVSRSISLAFAIADHFNLGRACIDWRMKPHGIHDDPPNAHVYGLARAALAEQEHPR